MRKLWIILLFWPIVGIAKPDLQVSLKAIGDQMLELQYDQLIMILFFENQTIQINGKDYSVRKESTLYILNRKKNNYTSFNLVAFT